MQATLENPSVAIPDWSFMTKDLEPEEDFVAVNKDNHPLNQDEPTKAWLSVERLVYDVCHGFRRHFNLDFDDLLDEALVIYTKAYKTFNPEKAKFTTYVRFCVWNGLMTYTRKRFKEAEKIKESAPTELDMKQGKQGFVLKQLLSEISGDAAVVVRLALVETSTDTLTVLEKASKTNRPEAILDQTRNNVIRTLIDDLEWSVGEVMRAFKEIREALC